MPPTTMWLMGMWISFTKNPTNPMTRKPTLVARAICMNSAVPGRGEGRGAR